MSRVTITNRHDSKPAGARLLPTSKIPKTIPPGSVVLLRRVDSKTTPDWKNDIGRVFRVGYYSEQDGLDCIWLVNESGEYEQTTDRATLLKHFLILSLSSESDHFGANKPPLKPLRRPPASYQAAVVIS